MSIITLATAIAVLTDRAPIGQAGIFDWIRDVSNEIVLTAIIVCAAMTVIASLVVFVRSKFSLGATLMTAATGAIVTFLVAGGITWLSDVLGSSV